MTHIIVNIYRTPHFVFYIIDFQLHTAIFFYRKITYRYSKIGYSRKCFKKSKNLSGFFVFVLFLFCFVLFCFVLLCFVLFCFALLCCVVLCCVVLCCVVLCFVLFWFCFVLFCFVFCLFVCLFVFLVLFFVLCLNNDHSRDVQFQFMFCRSDRLMYGEIFRLLRIMSCNCLVFVRNTGRVVTGGGVICKRAFSFWKVKIPAFVWNQLF